MGGIDPVTAAIVAGTNVADGIASRNSVKKEEEYLKTQQQSAINNRKNLLNQQLASRTTMLSAMGVSMDGSNQKSQQKIIEDGYQEINDVNSDYSYKYDKIKDQYNKQMYNSVSSMTKKVLI